MECLNCGDAFVLADGCLRCKAREELQRKAELAALDYYGTDELIGGTDFVVGYLAGYLAAQKQAALQVTASGCKLTQVGSTLFERQVAEGMKDAEFREGWEEGQRDLEAAEKKPKEPEWCCATGDCEKCRYD